MLLGTRPVMASEAIISTRERPWKVQAGYSQKQRKRTQCEKARASKRRKVKGSSPGHTFNLIVRNREGLQRRWKHQVLRYFPGESIAMDRQCDEIASVIINLNGFLAVVIIVITVITVIVVVAIVVVVVVVNNIMSRNFVVLRLVELKRPNTPKKFILVPQEIADAREDLRELSNTVETEINSLSAKGAVITFDFPNI